MCLTCGCGGDDVRVFVPRAQADGHGHDHPHEHPQEHRHEHPHEHREQHETLVLEERLLAKNDHLAGHVRALLAERRITSVNLMSSPGSGKTSLLERTITDLGRDRRMYVVEGDQETAFDADRIARAGGRAIQVNTGSGCHLDAGMVERSLRALDPEAGSLLFVENVGNLVCPALFDIGEHARVVVISVTEGDDKPLKYPTMFAAADLVVVNKVDLLPHVDFDVSRLADQARSLNPEVTVLPLSLRTGERIEYWYAWLDSLTAHATRDDLPGGHQEGESRGATVGP